MMATAYDGSPQCTPSDLPFLGILLSMSPSLSQPQLYVKERRMSSPFLHSSTPFLYSFDIGSLHQLSAVQLSSAYSQHSSTSTVAAIIIIIVIIVINQVFSKPSGLE